MIPQKTLINLYFNKKYSAKEIADTLGYSENGVNYWLKKHGIKKRTVSEAIYLKNNPEGDPFSFKKPQKFKDVFLYGLGIGLYWGEGTKKDTHAVRLGNSDPALIKSFIKFLDNIFHIKKNKLRFGLQIFGDMNKDEALQFWRKELGVSANKFQKVIITPHRGVGSYRQKTKYGVLTVYFSNKKLRDILCSSIESISMNKPM